MKPTDLMEALGEVPEELVTDGLKLPAKTALQEIGAAEEIPHSVPRGSRLAHYAAAIGSLAACAALIAGTVLLLGKLRAVPAQMTAPSSADSGQNAAVTAETVTTPSEPTVRSEEPERDGTGESAVTAGTVFSDDSVIAVSGRAVTIRQSEQTSTEPVTDDPRLTTPDPAVQGGTAVTRQTQTEPTEPQTTEPESWLLPYQIRYQFCEGTPEWRDEFDGIIRQSEWRNQLSSRLIRSYDEFRATGLSTEYPPEFFLEHSLICCSAVFTETGSVPEVRTVRMEKRGTSGLYDISVAVHRKTAAASARQHWFCLLEVENSDLGHLRDRSWYYAVIHMNVEFEHQKTDAARFLESRGSGQCYAWFDSIHHPVSGAFYSELAAPQNLRFRGENDGVAVIRDGETVFVVPGMPLINAYFADLNNDGMNELCVTWGFGSGMYSQGITVYDIRNNLQYTLHERCDYDYTLDGADGRLTVKRSESYNAPGVDPDAPAEVTGTIRIENGSLIFTKLR